MPIDFFTFPYQDDDLSDAQKDFFDKLEASLTYKENVSFCITPGEENTQVNVSVRLAVKSIDNPTKIIKASSPRITFDLDVLDFDFILQQIFSLVLELEIHEAKEWFKFNGKHVHDPHPELKTNE